MTTSPRRQWLTRSLRCVENMNRLLVLAAAMAASAALCAASPQNGPPPQSQLAHDAEPQITKVEPPNWWIGLTPNLLLLLSGHHLEATRVTCNLSTLQVTGTQGASGGDYLFVWL